MIHFGTSGFSYNDWVGSFYPPGLPRREWLRYYAREFDACELNSTYYALPRPTTLKAMVDKTGEGFTFAVKANQQMTHQRRDNAAVFQAFRWAPAPVVAAGKLGCVLAQFPYSFGFNQPNWDYLELFSQRLSELPVVVEFRNARWLRPEVFDWLKSRDLGFCCVDEPRLPNLLPPLAEATSNIGYVRFHGRNREKWWQHAQAYERYDYSYSPSELSEWLPRIQRLASVAAETFVFANNHWRGQAVDTIRQLRVMLD